MSARTRLKQLIARSGLTQAEIARRLDEHSMWVSNRCRGHSEILADDIPRLADAMNISPIEFFEDRGMVKPEMEWLARRAATVATTGMQQAAETAARKAADAAVESVLEKIGEAIERAVGIAVGQMKQEFLAELAEWDVEAAVERMPEEDQRRLLRALEERSWLRRREVVPEEGLPEGAEEAEQRE